MKTAAMLSLISLFLLGAFSTAFADGASLDGAWKPRDYGTRIEIDGENILILWMNRPQLKTTFTVTEEDGKTVLHLEQTGLRERGDQKDYAQITGLWVEDGQMHFVKVFDVAGEKSEVLSPTTESRYGNVTVVTEKELPRIEGVWKTKDRMDYTLKIEGEKISWRFAKSRAKRFPGGLRSTNGKARWNLSWSTRTGKKTRTSSRSGPRTPR